MKKSHRQLLALATKFERKYAQTQNLQDIIQNAASYGSSSANGIMNFPAQLKQDQADLVISVTLTNDGCQVSTPIVSPGDKTPNYLALPQQIQAYLDKNMENFQHLPRNQPVTLQYSGRTSDSGIARR